MRTRRADLSRIGAGRAALLLAVVVAFVALAAVAAFAVVTTLDAYEPDDTPATAKPLVLGAAKQMRTLHYTTGGDVDWVTFQAQQGKGYIIETGDLNPSTTDTVLELYAGDASTLLAQNDDFGFSFASRIAWSAPATGTYYVRVKGRHAGINGNYSLTLREAGAITGTVTEQGTGTALSGITVDLWQWDQDGYYVFFETQTNASGQYEFGAVPPGTWRVGFYDWTGTYEERYYNNKATVEEGNNVMVTAGATQSGINAVLRLLVDTTGPAATTTRLSDRTRFSTAVAVARAGFPSWTGVKNVVIASGDDRAAADPLAASGLCWAYDAPMLLVSAARTPDEVKAAVKEIVAKNGQITLRVVGGTTSVPAARLSELVAAGGGSAYVKVDRVLATGGRYDLAAAIALRMRSVAAADPSKTMPSVALFANGADASKFFDALALSPISAGTGAPILLVTADSVPTATQNAVSTLKPSTKIVGGGPNTVSEKVRSQLSATRWSGQSRYDTAIAIANGAVSRGWLNRRNVGIAAKLPDALTGGGFVGQKKGVLLLTDGANLTPATGTWLKANKAQVRAVHVFGGPLSVTENVMTQIRNALK